MFRRSQLRPIRPARPAGRVAIIAAIALWLASAASAGTVGELRILTSMPKSLFEPFAEAFERRHPAVSVIVLNKNTNASVVEIARGNPRGFDIFWASSAEAFAVLNARGVFLDAARVRPGKRRGKTTGGAFYPFAYSSIGWTQRLESRLERPAQWQDLLDPRYAGTIGMARPSRSGSTHMFVERFLQVRGWEDGWAYLLELAGNLSTVTSRSFAVIDGVEKQRFELGITIDFLAQSRRDSGLGFSYGKPVMVMRAQIGLLKGGGNVDAAVDFVDFVLSREGQELLLIPSIRRVPFDPDVRRAAPDVPREISDALQLGWQPYDALLARDRNWSVNALFDEFLTFQLPARQAAWARLRRLQAVQTDGQAARLALVRRLLTTMPVPEAEASDARLNEAVTRITAFSAPSEFQQARISDWAAQADALLGRAIAILDELEAQGGSDDR